MVVWAALTGVFSYENMLFGFLLGYGVLWVLTFEQDQQKYFKRVLQVFGFMAFFIREIIKANILVAYEVITPRPEMTPGIVAIPLDVKTDAEIAFLASVIALTPGSICLDVSSDKKTLYVHGMYTSNKQKFINEIKNGFEKRILNLMR